VASKSSLFWGAGFLVAAGALAVFLAVNAVRESRICRLPSIVPIIPNGATASRTDMTRARSGVKTYVAQLDRFMTCVDRLERMLESTASAEEKALVSARVTAAHDVAVERQEEIAAAFNKQLRLYNNRVDGITDPPDDMAAPAGPPADGETPAQAPEESPGGEAPQSPDTPATGNDR